MPIAAGLDGCRSGWVAAVALHRGTELRHFPDAAAALAWAEGDTPPVRLTVDMPLGLPARHGLRACDREARSLLGRRWMCVFAPPDRELFGLGFAAARELVWARRAADPDGAHPIATHETINITPKVAELDALIRVRPEREAWVAECHPELCFRTIAGHDLALKRTAQGAAARLELLAAIFPDAADRIAAAPWRRSEVARDDLLDAYAALWSALRFAAGTHRTLGDGGRDAHGLLERVVL